jgi:AbrB family looped-hinge helix DNA binding protein
MAIVKVSRKFRLPIPRTIREGLGIKPGQQLQVLQYLDRIEYVPLEHTKGMRGFLRGIDPRVIRDKDRV